jgi:hypothetical protein
MLKKGQVGMFVVIGIVVLAIFILVFFLRDQILTELVPSEDTERVLSIKMQAFTQHVNDCVDEKGREIIEVVINSGGILSPTYTLPYGGQDWTVLCKRVSDEENCVRDIVSANDIEKTIEKYLNRELKKCIDTSSFSNEPGYEFRDTPLNAEASLGSNALVVDLNYSVIILKDEIKEEKTKFTRVFNVALLDLIDIMNDILEGEAEGGFTTAGYSKVFLSEFEIRTESYLNNKFYRVIDGESGAECKFATEGEQIYD